MASRLLVFSGVNLPLLRGGGVIAVADYFYNLILLYIFFFVKYKITIRLKATVDGYVDRA